MPKLLTETALKALASKPVTTRKLVSDSEPGLVFCIFPTGRCSWAYRGTVDGKRVFTALGKYPEVTVGRARELVRSHRSRLANASPGDGVTVRAACESFLRAPREVEADTVATARQRLVTYVFPTVGDMAIRDLDGPAILRLVCEPIQNDGKAEMAYRVKHILSQVFRHAVVRGWVSTDPTQSLRDAVRKPTPEHHAAITDAASFGVLLRALDRYRGASVYRIATIFLAYCPLRSGELRGLTWDEVRDNTLVIPAARMKAKKDFRQPLSTQAMALLNAIPRRTGLVFANPIKDKPLSENAFRVVLEACGFDPTLHTAHGFRSTFATLTREALNEPWELVEGSLAHTVGSQVARAYMRDDMLEARRGVMQRWAHFVDSLRYSQATSEVLPA